jgi:hypothetical protein
MRKINKIIFKSFHKKKKLKKKGELHPGIKMNELGPKMNIIKKPYCDIKFKVRIWKAAALSLTTRFPLTATCDTKLPDMEETAQLDEESV